jgi:hypothetical protein
MHPLYHLWRALLCFHRRRGALEMENSAESQGIKPSWWVAGTVLRGPVRVAKPLFGGFLDVRVVPFAAFKEFGSAQEVVETVKIEHPVSHLGG